MRARVAFFLRGTVQGNAETVLIYPRLAKYAIVTEKYVPDSETVREIWKAKELGFRGLVPETDCGTKCAHHRLKVKLSEGNMEPLPPPPLIFSEGVLETGFNYDVGYQAAYRVEAIAAKSEARNRHVYAESCQRPSRVKELVDEDRRSR